MSLRLRSQTIHHRRLPPSSPPSHVASSIPGSCPCNNSPSFWRLTRDNRGNRTSSLSLPLYRFCPRYPRCHLGSPGPSGVFSVSTVLGALISNRRQAIPTGEEHLQYWRNSHVNRREQSCLMIELTTSRMVHLRLSNT